VRYGPKAEGLTEFHYEFVLTRKLELASYVTPVQTGAQPEPEDDGGQLGVEK
jgi:hypothetical protein